MSAEQPSAAPNPATLFATPAELVESPDYSPEQKRQFLREWAQDLESRQIADSEGMAPEMPTKDASLLRIVQNALRLVEGDNNSAGPF